MTPEERSSFQDIGTVMLNNLVGLPVFFLMYGFLAPMALMSIQSLIKRDQASRLTVVVCASGLAAFTAMAVFQLWLLVALDNVFLDHTTSLARRHSVYASKVAGPAKAINWLEFLPPVFNDAFIIWRTWVVFQRRKWALYLSLALCLSTFALTLTYLILTMNIAGHAADMNIESGRRFALNITFFVLSLSTNLVATSFIGWTLWSHLKFIKENLGNRHRRMFKVPHILALLVDSGAAYMTLQLVSGGLQFAGNPNIVAQASVYRVVSNIYQCISFVYPSITMFLVHGPFSIAGVHDAIMSLHESQGSENI